jgi:hypothetical protein
MVQGPGARPFEPHERRLALVHGSLKSNTGLADASIWSVKRGEDRRTFAIISHPDAGKATLTEKLLLFGEGGGEETAAGSTIRN